MAHPRAPDVVTVALVAGAMGKSPRFVRMLCEQGVLPARRIGRDWAIAGSVLRDLLPHAEASPGSTPPPHATRAE